MTTTHLDDAQLVDALETPDRHVSSCASCGERLARLREAVELAHVADVPEPPPFYWASMRRQVSRRIEDEVPARAPWRLWATLSTLAAVAGLAALLVRPAAPPASPADPTLPTWSALPEDDPAVAVLEGLEPSTDLLYDAGCGRVAECLSSLTDEETRELVASMRVELGEGGEL